MVIWLVFYSAPKVLLWLLGISGGILKIWKTKKNLLKNFQHLWFVAINVDLNTSNMKYFEYFMSKKCFILHSFDDMVIYMDYK